MVERSMPMYPLASLVQILPGEVILFSSLIWGACVLFSLCSKFYHSTMWCSGKVIELFNFKHIIILAVLGVKLSERCGLCWKYVSSGAELWPRKPSGALYRICQCSGCCGDGAVYLALTDASPSGPPRAQYPSPSSLKSEWTTEVHSVLKGNIPAFGKIHYLSGPKHQQIGRVGPMWRTLGIVYLVSSEVVPGKYLERLFFWLFFCVNPGSN